MFFANRIFGNKVLLRIEELLLEYLGPEDGGEAIGGLIGTIKLLETLKRFDLAIHFKGLRKDGFSIDDAAISIIDGTTTSLRLLAEEAGNTEALESLVPLFEKALDRHMDVRPGLVVPRNGVFGRAANEHLSKYFKDIK